MTDYAAPRREAALASALLSAALATFAVAVLAGGGSGFAAAATGAGLLLAAFAVRRPYIPWERTLALLVLVILFIPIRRYAFPGGLPFQLEPYRLLVALTVVGWAASLLVDPRVRLRRTGFEAPFALILLVTVGSLLANPDRFAEHQSTAVKGVTFFLSFVLVVALVASTVRTRSALDVVVKTLVAGGAVLGILAVVERRTGLTPFASLHDVVPFLVPFEGFEEIGRGGRARAVASSEHPIALSAVLVMLIPLAIYLVRSAGARWYLALAALGIGALSTVSRTGLVMLMIVGVVFLVLRPSETRRLWPLVLPLIVATHFAAPGTLGSLRAAFLPEGGLIAQQSDDRLSCDSAGRIADLDPTLAEVAKKPLLGYGAGTRVVTGPDKNACILDNQWLGTLVDVGIAGALAWLWLFVRAVGRFGAAAKRDSSPRGWLLAGAAASVCAFAVGMLTFDALGFVQVVFLLFLILGIGSAAAGPLGEDPEPAATGG